MARWRFALAAAGEATNLSFRAEIGPGPSGLTPAIEKMPEREEEIAANRLEEWTRNMTATIQGIKHLAEGGAATGS